MIAIRKNNAGDAWEESIYNLLELSHNSCNFIPTEYNIDAIELQNLIMTVNASPENHLSDKYFDKDFLYNFVNSFLDPKDSKQFYSRLFQYKISDNKSIDQINEVIKKLKKVWYSRRCVVDLWDVSRDMSVSLPPSLTSLQVSIRNNLLNMTVYFRSNNAWKYALPDMISLISLQKYIANKINVEIGFYTHFAYSYHIYRSDLKSALQFFREK